MKKYSVLLFDLDDTLYLPHSGLWTAIRSRIDQYMREKIGIPPEKISEMREAFFLKYGTTLRGLQTEYRVDAQDYLNFVHDIPLAEYIQPDEKLDQVLRRLPQRKVIFTNADRGHANRVLSRLRISQNFDTIVDILDIQPYCKPMPQAFTIALQKAGISDPAECLMFDDSQANLSAASAMGIDCVWVSQSGSTDTSNCTRIENLYGLDKLLSQS